MDQPNEIADRAMSLASSFIDGAVDEIAAMARGDLQALFQASQIVRERAVGPASSHAAEHLAFSLITAAHEQLRGE